MLDGASLRVPSRASGVKRLGGGGDVYCKVRRQDIVDSEAVKSDRLTIDDEHCAGLGLRA